MPIKYYTEGNSFQGFWWYKYGVSDVDKNLRSLLDRGFLQIGSLENAVEDQNTTILKAELKRRGFKTGGKKQTWFGGCWKRFLLMN